VCPDVGAGSRFSLLQHSGGCPKLHTEILTYMPVKGLENLVHRTGLEFQQGMWGEGGDRFIPHVPIT
jgi:hypothetical protein